MNERRKDILGDSKKLEVLIKTFGIHHVSQYLQVSKNTVNQRLEQYGLTGLEKKDVRDQEIFQEILKFYPEAIQPYRLPINPTRSDIFFPRAKMCLIYVDLRWYSEVHVRPNYLKEWQEYLDREWGLRSVFIFEDEWVHKKEQVIAKIKSLVGVDDREVVYARKCSIDSVPNPEVKSFYDATHIQGHTTATYTYVLKYDGEAVAAMSFKRTRGYYELVRYSTSKRVVGGFSRLLNHFWKQHPEIDSLVSFADKRWSDGNVYSSNGWEHVDTTRPNYYYNNYRDIERILKQRFRKQRIKADFPEYYDDRKTERQMMAEIGFHRIHDIGLMKYELKRK